MRYQHQGRITRPRDSDEEGDEFGQYDEATSLVYDGRCDIQTLSYASRAIFRSTAGDSSLKADAEIYFPRMPRVTLDDTFAETGGEERTGKIVDIDRVTPCIVVRWARPGL